MKLPSFKEALSAGKDKLNEMMIPSKVATARKKAELKMCELDEHIASKQVEIQKLCTSEDVDFDRLIEKQDYLALVMRRKDQYEQILDEMFPQDAA